MADEERPTLMQILVAGVGYTGLPMVWILKRRLLSGGGLQRMIDLETPNWKTKLGGVGLICTGVSGVLGGVACMTSALSGGHFMADVGSCWAMILVGATTAFGGWTALGIGHKLERGIEAAKAASVLAVAVAPEPPSATSKAGIQGDVLVDNAQIDKAIALVTAPPLNSTPVPESTPLKEGA